MQFLIDTATDKPSELYKIGRFLVDNFEIPAPPSVADVDAALAEHGLSRMPEAPATFTPSSDDVEVEIDSEGNISPMVAEVTLVTLTTPPPPPVPAVVPDPVPAAPGAVAEFDSKGYPWDARIHASNRAKKLDLSWKYKRGVDSNLVVAVEAQIKPAAPPVMSGAEAQAANFGRALRADSSPSAPASTESPVSAKTAPPPPPPPPVPLPASTDSVPAPPTVEATSTPVASTLISTVDFRGLMIKIQQSKTAGKLSDEQVAAAMGSIGLKLEDMALLIDNAALRTTVSAAIDKCLSG